MALLREAIPQAEDLKRREWFREIMGIVQRPFFELRVRYGSVPLKDFKPKQTRRGVKAGAWGKRKLYEGAFITDKIRAICLRVKARRGSQSRSYGDHPSATGPSNPQPGAKRRKSLSCAFFLSSDRTCVSSRRSDSLMPIARECRFRRFCRFSPAPFEEVSAPPGGTKGTVRALSLRVT